MLGSVSAGSNGDAPQEGQDWIITQDTHVWDSEINVKDIVVTFGKTLKLENVSLSSLGLMDINGDTRWINSTIYHEQSNSGENISLQSKLTIINSDFTLRTIQDNEKETANCLYLSPGSSLIIRDYDLNADTISDRSTIKSDVSGKGNYTEKFNYTTDIHGNIDAKVEIVNSEFEYINLLKFNSEGSYIRNSTFNLFGSVVTNSEGFIFENNTMTDSYKWWDLDITGNDSFLYNNTLVNGSGGIAIQSHRNHIEANNFLNFTFVQGTTGNSYSKRGEATLFLNHGSSNNTIISNHFENLVNINALTSYTSRDNVITLNNFSNAGHNWHTVKDLSGYRNSYNNNSFHSCAGENRDENWLYAACIIFWSYSSMYSSFPDAYHGGEHIIENNTFENYNTAVNVLSYQNNNTLRNNKLNGGSHGLGLWNWNTGGTTAPSGNLIFNNTINNTRFSIVLDYFHAGYSGANNSIISNNITNSDGRAITVWNYFKDFTISDNYIENATTGIWIYDDGNYGDVGNGVITNNTVIVKGQGLSTYSSSGGSTYNLHITNNYFKTEFGNAGGNGILIRSSIDSYVANNTIITNDTFGSSAAGIFAYFVPNLMIENNSITSSVGIEAGGVDDPTRPINIDNNRLHVTEYGIFSNRSHTILLNNYIEGTCNHDNCDIIYLKKVSKSGIFSEEGYIEITNNTLINFYEGFGMLRNEFYIQESSIDFSGLAVNISDSNGEIVDNLITNSTTSIEAFKSNIEIKLNNFINFERAIYTFNSTSIIDSNDFTEGDFCIDSIDSDTIFQNNQFGCREIDYLLRYNLRINVADEGGSGFGEHDFEIVNSLGNKIIDSQTNEEGFSKYFLIDVNKKEADLSEISYNPIRIIFYNNNIEVQKYINLSYNQTIIALLDTTPPQSEIISGTGLVNKDVIELEILLLNDDDDFKEYVLEYIVDDEFAEWEVYGVYANGPISFLAEDGKEYRFRVLARDIYGNTEEKVNYEYQVLVDTSVPETELLNFDDDYYFIGNNQIELIWINNAEDISYNTIKVEYSNFTNSNLNPNSVTWNLIESIVLYDETTYNYDFSDIGHYAFTIEATDYAGNSEVKTNYDVIMNYATKTDTIFFSEVPTKWGSNNLDVTLERSNLNLDYKLYIAIQSIEEGNNALTWYLLPHLISSNLIELRDLQDSTRYFVYAESRDLAGNIEDPLNTTEFFSSNGQYNQQFELKYIPVTNEDHNFIITVDNDLDGTYEKELNRGFNKNKLLVDQFYLDVTNKTIIFGGTSNGGFVPTEDINDLQNIKVEYSGVHLIFEIYTDDPAKADSLTISHSNATELIITYNIPQEAETCRVQMTTDVSNWFTQEIIAPCESGFYEYYHKDPEPEKQYYYRIMIEDEFGHQSFSDNRTADMQDIIKLYSSGNANTNNQFGMKEILPAAIGISLLFLLFGGVLLYRSKGEEELDENVSVIESKPVAKYKVEELYLIYKDGRLLKNVSAVEVKTDTDIMSGMLTAINDFVQDSFNTEGDLGSIDYGNNKIILQRGNHSYLAAVIYGEIDNKFKGKLINAVRTIETINPSMNNWDGDGESVKQTELYLNPIIDETIGATREMVDNYFTEKEIVVTTAYEKIGTNIEINVNISNYSSASINNCKISPEFNSSLLGLVGIDPDIFYSFADNSFTVGEVSSYNEIQFKLRMQIKAAGQTTVEIKMGYEQKGRKGTTLSTVDLI